MRQSNETASKTPKFKGIDHYSIGFDLSEAPAATRVIYADGSAGADFRPGVDLELSHWIPTTTPEPWAADTSTETCFRFIESDPTDIYDLVVNNHIDVDGILSLFVLLHPELAANHRDIVIGAAEHGDLQASTSHPAVILAQELTTVVTSANSSDTSLHELYAEAFDATRAALHHTLGESDSAATAWEQIKRGHDLIDRGEVTVELVSPRFVAFGLPQMDQESLVKALRVPPFNAVVDGSVWLWPHARNRDHGQRVQLVSIPGPGGWYHDLWLPGYAWAHTPDRWRVPGLYPSGGSNAWVVRNPALDQAVGGLESIEEQTGRWVAFSELTPFSTLRGRGFPVAVSFLDDQNRPTPSSLNATVVAQALATAFDD